MSKMWNLKYKDKSLNLKEIQTFLMMGIQT